MKRVLGLTIFIFLSKVSLSSVSGHSKVSYYLIGQTEQIMLRLVPRLLVRLAGQMRPLCIQDETFSEHGQWESRTCLCWPIRGQESFNRWIMDQSRRYLQECTAPGILLFSVQSEHFQEIRGSAGSNWELHERPEFIHQELADKTWTRLN